MDIINGKANHIIKFKKDENFVIFDIYNDINYLSLRNTGIIFLPLEEEEEATSQIIINYKISNGNYIALETNQHYKTIYGITHIRFTKTKYFGGKPISIYYRLRKNEYSQNLFSEKCSLEFQLDEVNVFDVIPLI